MFCPDLNGYKFWDEICRVDQSIYLLFDVIFSDFTTECVLSDWFISKPCFTAVLTEAPDQSSEEPRVEIVSDYREGKPWT